MIAAFLIFAFLFDAIAVHDGILHTQDGKEVKINSGTFIPDPEDKALAKGIVDRDAEIAKLRVQLTTCESKQNDFELWWKGRENKLTEFYETENVRLKTELDSKDSWWNRWGSQVVVGILSMAIGGFVGYEVGRTK
jgi:hypothetical protein